MLTAIVTLIYPLVIWLGHEKISPRSLAFILAITLLLRLLLLDIKSSEKWLLGILALLLFCATMTNLLLPLQLYPVAVNVIMLIIFSYSLFFPPTVVERIARLTDPALTVAGVRYTRRVTQVWCVFFIANGAISLATALWASPAVWSLYNGVIAYILIGLLFSIEYIVRLYVKRLHHASR